MGVTTIEYRRPEIRFFAPTCRLGRLSITSNKFTNNKVRTHKNKLIKGGSKRFQFTTTVPSLIIVSKTSFVVVDVPCLDYLPLSVAWPVSWLDPSLVDRLESLFSLVPAALCVA